MTKTAVATGDFDDDGEWLSTRQAAVALGVTPRTLFRFIDQGLVPVHRFGRVVRVRRDELWRFLEQL